MKIYPILPYSSSNHKAIVILCLTVVIILFIPILHIFNSSNIKANKSNKNMKSNSQEGIVERTSSSTRSSSYCSTSNSGNTPDNQQQPLFKEPNNHTNNQTKQYQQRYEINNNHLSDIQKARLKQQEQVRESSMKAREKRHKKKLEKLERSYFPLSSSAFSSASSSSCPNYHWENYHNHQQQQTKTKTNEIVGRVTSPSNNTNVKKEMELKNESRSPDEIRSEISNARMKQQEQVRQSAIKAKERRHRKEMERLKRSYFPLPSK